VAGINNISISCRTNQISKNWKSFATNKTIKAGLLLSTLWCQWVTRR